MSKGWYFLWQKPRKKPERTRDCAQKKHRDARPDLVKAKQARFYIKFLEREGYVIMPPINPIHELYADKKGRA